MSTDGQPALEPIGLPPDQFAAAFPFHVAMDSEFGVIQVGSTLSKVCPDVFPGSNFALAFKILRPMGDLTWKFLLEHQRLFFLLEHRASHLQLRGEFMMLPGRSIVIFLGSPWFTDAQEIADRGLGFEDFAVHDAVVDLLQVFQASKLALEDAKRLNAKLVVQRAELRSTNERLRQQEAEARKLALVAARTDNGVVLTDAAGLTIWVNDGFCRQSGYTLADMLGRTPGSVLQGPATDSATVQWMHASVSRGEPFTTQVINYTKSGRTYWNSLEVQPVRDESGKLLYFMALQRDVTEERAAQQRLAIQFEVSRVLTDSNNFSTAFPGILSAICGQLGWSVGQIWRVERDRLIFQEVWNPTNIQVGSFISASRRRNFARGEGLPGRVWATARPEWLENVCQCEDFPRAESAREVNLRGGFAFPIIVRGHVWGVIEFFSRFLEMPDEPLLRTMATVGNQLGQFIVRREAEEALRESKAAAEAANQAKSDFLAVMSHEIRTPLNAVLGMTQLLLQTPLNARQMECARIAVHGGEALLELINEILDFSKIESGEHFQLDRDAFDLHQMLNGVTDLLRPRAEAQGLTLEVKIVKDVPRWVEGDSARIRQILVNLVSNAIKFTEEGGISLIITRLTATLPSVRLRFEVNDTGVGIRSDDLARLFQVFTQVDRDALRRRGGTGLGLAISKRLVELMGGQIGVESVVGKGSSFWFELPLSNSEPHVETAAALKAGLHDLSAYGLRILAADDNEANRRLVEFTLEEMGLRADYAVNGLEVIEAWKKKDYNLILMDCQMPLMNGFDAARYIREQEAAIDTPPANRVRIVALTANALKGVQEQCMEAGMDAFLTKPFTVYQLGQVLASDPKFANPSSDMPISQSSTDGSPKFSPTIPDQLVTDLGSESAIMIVEDFLAELPDRLAELPLFASQGRSEELSRLAHSLQGMGLSVGLDRFGAKMKELEQLALAGDAKAIDDLIAKIPEEAELGVSELRSWISRLPKENHDSAE